MNAIRLFLIGVIYLISLPIAIVWSIRSGRHYSPWEVPGMLYYRSETKQWPSGGMADALDSKSSTR